MTMASGKPDYPFLFEPWAIEALKPATPESVLELIEDDKVIAYCDDTGGILIQDLGDGDCEWHWMFPPGTPSAEIKHEVEILLRQLHEFGFNNIVGRTPIDNLKARIMNRYWGAQEVGRENGHILYHFDIDAWVNKVHRL